MKVGQRILVEDRFGTLKRLRSKAARRRVVIAVRRAMPHLLVFGGLGPPIGCVILLPSAGFVAWALSPSPSLRDFGEGAVQLLMLIMIGVPFSYVVGFLPAVATGAIAAVTPRTPRRVFFGVVTAGGAIASATFALLVSAGESWWFALVLAGIGGCAAFSCGWLTRRVHPVWAEPAPSKEHAVRRALFSDS